MINTKLRFIEWMKNKVPALICICIHSPIKVNLSLPWPYWIIATNRFKYYSLKKKSFFTFNFFLLVIPFFPFMVFMFFIFF